MLRQQQQQLEQAALMQRMADKQEEQAKQTKQESGGSKGSSQGTQVSPVVPPQVPVALQAPKLPGTGPVPRTSLGMLPKAGAWNVGANIGGVLDQTINRPFNYMTGLTNSYGGSQQGGIGQLQGHYADKFLNPWSDAWEQETNDGVEEALKWGSRASTAVGAVAGTAAASIAAAPAMRGGLGLFRQGTNLVSGTSKTAPAATGVRGFLQGAKRLAGRAWNAAENVRTADWLTEAATGRGITDRLGLGASSPNTGYAGPSGSASGVGTTISSAPSSNLVDIPTYGSEKYRGKYNPDNWSNLPSHGFKMPNLKKASVTPGPALHWVLQQKQAKLGLGWLQKAKQWGSGAFGAAKTMDTTADAAGASKGVFGKTMQAGKKGLGWLNNAVLADYGLNLTTGSGLTDWMGFGGGDQSQQGVGAPQSQPQGMWNVPESGPAPVYNRYNPETWSDQAYGDDYSTPEIKTASYHMRNISVPVGPAMTAYRLQEKQAGKKLDAVKSFVNKAKGWAFGPSQAASKAPTPAPKPTSTVPPAAAKQQFGEGGRSVLSPDYFRGIERYRNRGGKQYGTGASQKIPKSPRVRVEKGRPAPKVDPTAAKKNPVDAGAGGGFLSRHLPTLGIGAALGTASNAAMNSAMTPDVRGMTLTDEFGDKVSPSHYTEATGSILQPWTWGQTAASEKRDLYAKARQMFPDQFRNINQEAGGNSGSGSSSGRSMLPSSLYSTVKFPEYTRTADYYRNRILADTQGKVD